MNPWTKISLSGREGTTFIETRNGATNGVGVQNFEPLQYIHRIFANSIRKALAFYRFRRTRRGTSAAIGALACINDVNGIAFADCFDRTFRNAGPAGYAGIGNNMWHRILLAKK
jgi:hypothetical protein